MSRPAAIEARGWGWRHAGRRPWALDGLDLVVEPGERVLLLGPSGSGKSTLLAALAGVLAEDQGESRGSLTIDGRHPRSVPGRAGLVLQDPQSQVILPRVGDDAAFGAENLGVPADEVRMRVASALAAVGLDVPLDASATRLSGGRQQRLALAGVLAMQPGLVLLDEPTANLDPDGVTEVRDAVDAAVRATGATLLVVEHRVAVWRDVVDRVVVLASDGTVLADGAPRTVLDAAGEGLAAQGVWVPGRSPVLARPPAPAPRALLATRDLVVGRDRRPVLAVPDLGLDAARLTAVTGPNGVGKTTLALTLGGLIRPVAGEVAAVGGARRGTPRGTGDLALAAAAVPDLGRVPVAAAPVPRRHRPRGAGRRAPGAPPDHRPRWRPASTSCSSASTWCGWRRRTRSPCRAASSAGCRSAARSPPHPGSCCSTSRPSGRTPRTWASLVTLLLEAVADGSGVVAVTHDEELAALADDRIGLEPTRSVLA